MGNYPKATRYVNANVIAGIREPEGKIKRLYEFFFPTIKLSKKANVEANIRSQSL